MGRQADKLWAESIEAIAATYHAVPPAQWLIERAITRLTMEEDVHLRWRVGRLAAGSEYKPITLSGAGKPNRPATWQRTSIGTRHNLFLPLPWGLRAAVGFYVGENLLVGTVESGDMDPSGSLFKQTDNMGQLDPNGEYSTVDVRVGPPNGRFVVGATDRVGRELVTSPTEVLSPNPIPGALHRV